MCAFVIALTHTQTMGFLYASVLSPAPSQKSCRASYALVDPDELFDNSFKTPSVFCEYNLVEVNVLIFNRDFVLEHFNSFWLDKIY
jgi:hypothetical protein